MTRPAEKTRPAPNRPSAPPAAGALLRLEDLTVSVGQGAQTQRLVEGLSLTVAPGETVGLVGESGCGKSMSALALMGLLPPGARVERGQAWFDGLDLFQLPPAALRDLRGNRLSMIFQEPMTSLNPLMAVGRQVAEVYTIHQGLSTRQAHQRAVEMLALVAIPEPERVAAGFPHQLSGGMRQRVMIAMALACNPALLIADEPTTALDVTVQAQILELMAQLKARLNTALLLITHDLGVVAGQASRVVVMYAGRKVEEAPVAALFTAPRHPYTLGLLRALPSGLTPPGSRLAEIPGQVPHPLARPAGCLFAPRCPRAQARCHQESPPLTDLGQGVRAACFYPNPMP